MNPTPVQDLRHALREAGAQSVRGEQLQVGDWILAGGSVACIQKITPRVIQTGPDTYLPFHDDEEYLQIPVGFLPPQATGRTRRPADRAGSPFDLPVPAAEAILFVPSTAPLEAMASLTSGVGGKRSEVFRAQAQRRPTDSSRVRRVAGETAERTRSVSARRFSVMGQQPRAKGGQDMTTV